MTQSIWIQQDQIPTWQKTPLPVVRAILIPMIGLLHASQHPCLADVNRVHISACSIRFWHSCLGRNAKLAFILEGLNLVRLDYRYQCASRYHAEMCDINHLLLSVNIYD